MKTNKNKRAKTKLKKKQQQKTKNKTKLNKPTLNVVNNIIFTTIICFVNSKTLFIILLHSKRCFFLFFILS